MIDRSLADELRTMVLFRHLTDEQLDVLCEDGHMDVMPAGAICVEGEPATCFYVLVDGEVAISKRSGDVDIEIDRTAQRGAYFGAISASMPNDEFRYEASARLTRVSRLFVLDARFFAHFMQTYWPVATHLLEGHTIGGIRQRQLVGHREMLLALGTITAGLTHQLNNPAAATARAVAGLREDIDRTRAFFAMVADGRFCLATVRALVDIQQSLARHIAETNQPQLSPMSVADHEERIIDWLDEQGVVDGWDHASSFVEAGLDVAWLQHVSDVVADAASLDGVLGWLKHTANTELRIAEITEASQRISALVAGTKQYSQMDRGDYQCVDVHELLRSTMLMFGDKIAMAGKGLPVTLVKELDRTLPEILCYPADLNQVWTNLIENAVEAMGGSGTLTVRTMREGESMVRVEICDDGPGVPAGIVDRIFTPFFTTKPVGAGTGLGLDLAWRIVVDKHRGTISVVSEPGHTRFIVCLPLRAPAPEFHGTRSGAE